MAGLRGVNMATAGILGRASSACSAAPRPAARPWRRRQRLLSARKYASSTSRRPVSVSDYCLDTIK